MFIRQDGPELEVLAPAKINLFLEVTGKRDDGFHDLDMLMVPVALYDTVKLILQQSPEISLTSRWAFGLESQPALPPAHENLVMQALELFQQRLQEKHGKSFGLSVDLVKRIPAAAGLGGASSDAAAALVGANRLNGNLLSLEELIFMAAQVGSDVPFFLYQSPARCQGRGEKVTPVSSPQSLPVVLVKPTAGLSTPSVFGRVAEFGFEDRQSIDDMLQVFTSGDLSGVGRALHNRLLEPALAVLPELQGVVHLLQDFDVAGFQMTGSGSTFFMICRHANQAKNLAARLRQMKLGAVIDTYTIGQPFGCAA